MRTCGGVDRRDAPELVGPRKGSQSHLVVRVLCGAAGDPKKICITSVPASGNADGVEAGVGGGYHPLLQAVAGVL